MTFLLQHSHMKSSRAPLYQREVEGIFEVTGIGLPFHWTSSKMAADLCELA